MPDSPRWPVPGESMSTVTPSGVRMRVQRIGMRTVPALNTFLTDVGAGLDFSIVGIYVAKAVSVAGEPPNVFIRIRHRF